MAHPVVLPRQGQSVETCIITEFFKQVGDTVEKGEVLYAYETDKASFEGEAPESGTLLAIFPAPGDEVPVLTNIAVIGKEGEAFEEFKPGSVGTAEGTEKKVIAPQEADAVKKEEPIEKSVISEMPVSGSPLSPRARALAHELGINPDTVQGSGPHGRIIERDILRVAENTARLTPLAQQKSAKEKLAAPQRGTGPGGRVRAEDLQASAVNTNEEAEIVPFSNIRKLISRAMLNSIQHSAQLTHHLSANAAKILAFRQEVKKAMEKGYPANITLNDIICYVVIRVLKEQPRLNAHFLGDSLKQFKKVHLGLAVDTERGLMVPSIRNAGEMSLAEFSVKARQVAEECRKGSVNPDLLSAEAAGFTVSNLGNYRIEMFTPIINLPQVAILGVNTIIQRPVQDGFELRFAPHLGLSLTYDHRALDGGEASRFLMALAEGIENFNEALK